MHIIDLRSDTATRPSPDMRRFMAEASVGDEQYGEDPTVNSLQEEIAALLGKEAALFLPSTTMANQIAFKTLTQPGDEIVIEAYAHPMHYEAGGLAFHSGLMPRLVHGERGIFTAEQVQSVVHPQDPHHGRASCLTIENTHNQGGGSVWPLPLLQSVCAKARELQMNLHLDGSRLFNACVASVVTPAAYAAPFDAISICFSKGLGAPVGSCLVGSKALISEARHYKQLFGGAMRQAGIIAAGALYALRHNIDRLAEDHANAKRLAIGLADIPGIEINSEHVETNIVYFGVAKTGLTAAAASERLAREGVLISPSMGYERMRAVTHLDVSATDIERAIAVANRVLHNPAH